MWLTVLWSVVVLPSMLAISYVLVVRRREYWADEFAARADAKSPEALKRFFAHHGDGDGYHHPSRLSRVVSLFQRRRGRLTNLGLVLCLLGLMTAKTTYTDPGASVGCQAQYHDTNDLNYLSIVLLVFGATCLSALLLPRDGKLAPRRLMLRGSRFALIALAISIAWSALFAWLATPLSKSGGLAFPTEYRFIQRIDLLFLLRDCVGLPLAFIVIALATLTIELASRKAPIGGGFNLLKVACVTGISGLALGALDLCYSRSVRLYAEREIRSQYAAFAARKERNIALMSTLERCFSDDRPMPPSERDGLEAEEVIRCVRASTAWAPGGWFWLVRPAFHNAIWHSPSLSGE
jgi:hypothetical protein